MLPGGGGVMQGQNGGNQGISVQKRTFFPGHASYECTSYAYQDQVGGGGGVCVLGANERAENEGGGSTH